MIKRLKQITGMILILGILASFVSCSDSSIASVNADNTAAYYSKTTFGERELDALQKQIKAGDNSYSEKYGLDATNIDSTIADLKSNLKKEIIDGETYYYSETSEEFASTNELEKYIVSNSTGESKSIIGEFQNASISPTEAWIFSGNDVDIDSNLAINCIFRIKLPYNVVKTNGTIVDANTVEFDILKNQHIKYVTTDKSTASWTKSSDIENEIKTIISNQNVPNKTSGLRVGYKNKTSLKVSWNFGSVNYSCDSLGYELQRKINSGSWISVKTIDDFMKNSYVEKNIKVNATYSYRVRTVSSISGIKSYGPYSTTASITTINFKTKPVVKSIMVSKNKATIKLKKKIKNATGYQVQYSQTSKFSKSKKLSSKKTNIKIKNLKSKKTYYFRVRACKKVNGKTYYGAWSKVIKRKIK